MPTLPGSDRSAWDRFPGIVGQLPFAHCIAPGETGFVLPFDYLWIVYAFVIVASRLNDVDPEAWLAQVLDASPNTRSTASTS